MLLMCNTSTVESLLFPLITVASVHSLPFG
jgi:hypothetical protein